MNNTKINDCIHEVGGWKTKIRYKIQDTGVAESCWLTTN